MNDEFEPLLPPGFHDLKLDAVEAALIAPFEEPTRRIELMEGLSRFRAMLADLGLTTYSMWLDGSLASTKPAPQDVDLLIVASELTLEAIDPERQQRLKLIFSREKRPELKIRYLCDPYLALDSDENQLAYWRGWFGFDRLERPKGIIRVAVAQP